MGYDKELYVEYGDKIWFNDTGQLHRTDGPAIEYANGEKVWCINGKLHRLDGPAAERPNGNKAWWIHDEELTKEEFNNHPLVLQHQLLKELDNGI